MFSRRKPAKKTVRKTRIFQHSLDLKPGSVAVTVRKSHQSKRVRIIVRPGGEVTVTAPLSVSDVRLFQFLEAKRGWIGEKRRVMKEQQNEDIQGTPEEYQAYREQAKALAEERLAYWNQRYGFHWNRVTIRNQKTRWGSCSKAGNLSFSYKIALLSQEQTDYIIVHELCHLGEFNHSHKFWALVAKAIPDYSKLRHSLKMS